MHVRSDGDVYVAGSTPEIDPAVPFDDFAMDSAVWEEQIWPVLAHRIPAFERAKVLSQWAGHYAHNTLDHNAVIGPHTEVRQLHLHQRLLRVTACSSPPQWAAASPNSSPTASTGPST